MGACPSATIVVVYTHTHCLLMQNLRHASALQPAEEGGGGGKQFVDEGVLKDVQVSLTNSCWIFWAKTQTKWIGFSYPRLTEY